MLVPKRSMRLILAREDVGKGSGKKTNRVNINSPLPTVRDGYCLPRALRKKSLKHAESAGPIGAARRSLLEQRATGELSPAGPIGAARRSVKNLLEQRAGEGLSTAKPIGAARRTYWSSAQVSQKPIGAARRWV
jgi:hypothetical protein